MLHEFGRNFSRDVRHHAFHAVGTRKLDETRGGLPNPNLGLAGYRDAHFDCGRFSRPRIDKPRLQDVRSIKKGMKSLQQCSSGGFLTK
jgi:hypothetical protein